MWSLLGRKAIYLSQAHVSNYRVQLYTSRQKQPRKKEQGEASLKKKGTGRSRGGRRAVTRRGPDAAAKQLPAALLSQATYLRFRGPPRPLRCSPAGRSPCEASASGGDGPLGN